MLDKKTLRRLAKNLRREKAELEEELAGTASLGLRESLTDSVKELSAYDNHPADLGSETFEREKDFGLFDAKRLNLMQINDALSRMEEGKYGVCSICGRSIDLERLEVVPQTVTCLDCQKKLEIDGIGKGNRPIEERVLAYPFGRTFLDDTDNVGIDGEDVWQEVARYGTSESPQDLGGDFLGGDVFGEDLSYDQMYSDEPRGVAADVENEQVQEEGADEV